MRKEEFQYELPQNRIALYPSQPRDSCKLIVVHRDTGSIQHLVFRDIINYLNSGDCLVLNESKVHPVRFKLRRKTGGVIELLFTTRLSANEWISLARPAKRIKAGERLIGEKGEEVVEIIDIDQGKANLRLLWEESRLFSTLGLAPLPGYIQRDPENHDLDNYQTVFARDGFSIAAPTAGLHFTSELLNQILNRGVEVAYIQLDVGEGTFRPIKADNVEEHRMLAENYSIPDAAADKINNAKRVIAVGTTVTRTLESFAADQLITPGRSSTELFIYPGHQFRHIDILLTNFHQPSSTPILLTSAFTGKDLLLKAYREALEKDYRFLSYGDAMLIL